MATPTPDIITRKELVALSGYKFSERTLCNHEKEWGLVRAKWCRRPVIYNRAQALGVLRSLGHLGNE